MRRLLHYMKPFWGAAVAAIVLSIVQTAIDLILPTINAQITNEIISPDPSVQFVIYRGLIMLGVVLFSVAGALASSYFASRASMGFGRELREAVFTQVETFSQGDIDKFGAPSLITRSTNDIQQVQNATFMMMRMMIFAPIMCIGGVIMALRQDVGLSWVLLAAMPFIGVLMGYALTRGLPYFRIIQQKVDKLNLVLREFLTGIRVIRAFNRSDAELARFDQANDDMRHVSVQVGNLMAILMPGMSLILSAVTVTVLWFGGLRVNAGEMDVGSIQAFITYANMILMSLMMSTMLFILLPRAQASAQRINEVLDTTTDIQDPATPKTIAKKRGEVVFDNVSFAYPGAEEPVLCDIDFSARPGEQVAIIGSTGSGKSTLVNLLPRLFDVTQGRILIDDTDIRDITQEELRSMIGYVPQRAFLFSGTVAENLRYGNEGADDARLWEALGIAQAKDFVQNMPEGLDAPISQGGTNVSGGQRQRLSIARALVRRPQIYIFDDCFSALDFQTDARLRAALREEVQDATIFIVAQRVSSIMSADKILVIDEGRIAGIGTHQELLKSNEVYKQIVLSQLTEEEIA